MLRPKTIERRPSTDEMLPGDQNHEPPMASQQLSCCMDEHDLENPMNWPLHRKLYTSLVAWMFAAAV